MAAALSCPSMLDAIDLDQARPIAVGGGRRIYAHPCDKNLLIKVIDPQARAQYMMRHRFKRWYKRLHRASAYRGFIGEFSESVIVAARNAHWDRLPMARVAGVVDTSQGPGLLVEKIRGLDQDLAPTLEAVVRQHGLGPELRQALDALLQAFIAAHIVINDMSASNIVMGTNAQGKQGLFLIDGFGVKQKVPLYALSKSLNARHLREHFGQMLGKLERIAAVRQSACPPAAAIARNAPRLADILEEEIEAPGTAVH
ncbi:YrbL family protein [Orrella sp. JC864]|uniref:YrbL family protein n=1 Tax=Orrella sp. JC864 TaxID=3120298 RepID=UPI0012BC34FC